MLTDFPLLDRGQPPLNNESRSTITRDFLLLHARRRTSGRAEDELTHRVSRARAQGAIPYVPSEVLAETLDSEMMDYG
jgi:hypothetical protein